MRVTAAGLRERLDAPNTRILDVRPLPAYLQGHIPGAVWFDVNLIVGAEPHFNIVSGEWLASLLGEVGISPETTVIIYDQSNGYHATRLWWTMTAYNHADVQLLDGGFAHWAAPISTQAPSITPASYPIPALDTAHLADLDEVRRGIDDPGTLLIDTRTTEEFTGQVAYAKHGGHIPGALHIDWQRHYQSGLYLPPDDLRTLYAPALDTACVITYCQIGYRATATYFALHLLGLEHVAVYDASWSAWGNRDDTPIA